MLSNLVLLAVELWGLAALVLALHRLSPRYGLVPLLLLIGGLAGLLQPFQRLGVFVRPVPNLTIALSSNTLVPILLLAILVIYTANGTVPARLAACGIAAMNGLGLVLVAIQGLHLALPGGGSFAGLPSDSPLFLPSPRRFLAFLLTLLADLSIIAVVYQAAVNRLSRLPAWAAPAIALLATLWTDALLYPILAFGGTPRLLELLPAHLAWKTLAAALLFPLASFYLLRVAPRLPGYAGAQPRATFDLLFGTGRRLEAALTQAEGALRESQDRFRSLFAGVPVGLYRITPNGRFLEANPAQVQMLGHPDLETLQTTNAGQFYANPKDRERWKTQMDRHGIVRDFDVPVRRRDGTIIWLRSTARAVRDTAGRLLYYEGSTKDVTERKQAEEIRKRLLERVISAQEEERRRIARELHDETGQSLTSLLLHLEVLEGAESVEQMRHRIAPLRGVVAGTLEEIQRLVRALRPSILDDLGLIPALERLVRSTAAMSGLQTDFVTQGLEGTRLSPTLETTLYRIVQEALTNVVKHARAQNVSVLLERRGQAVIAVVEDDGAGFDVAAARRGEKGLGLASMEERVSLLNGTLTIESRSGMGTTVVAEIPLDLA